MCEIDPDVVREIIAENERMIAVAKDACGEGSSPSDGRSWVDELAGLLRVARLQRDDARRQLMKLRV